MEIVNEYFFISFLLFIMLTPFDIQYPKPNKE